MSSLGDDTPRLIQTKLQRPHLGPDLIPRSHLIKQLNQGLNRKITLISAQAGAGKTTLLVQWLEGCSQTSAWLSLDEHDNDLLAFASYFCGAIQTVFPDACEGALALFEQNRLIDEALTHAFSAGQIDRAARIVARQRYRLMNQARWQRLEQYLRRFPPQFASQQPDLLMLKA